MCRGGLNVDRSVARLCCLVDEKISHDVIKLKHLFHRAVLVLAEQLPSNCMPLCFSYFLADRSNGRAYGTMLCPSVVCL